MSGVDETEKFNFIHPIGMIGLCKCQSQIVHLLESQNVQLLESIIASFFRLHHIYLAF